MKNRFTKFLLLVLGVLIALSSFGQRKKDILAEINGYAAGLVNTATYDNYSEIWNAIYVIATEECNTIVRESETKGYIEARQESEFQKKYLTIEIRGDKAPYRVSFLVKLETRYKNEGAYTNWKESSSNNSYVSQLQYRLYRKIHGGFTLTEELQNKVDNYNEMQTKDRLKIIKGKDY